MRIDRGKSPPKGARLDADFSPVDLRQMQPLCIIERQAHMRLSNVRDDAVRQSEVLVVLIEISSGEY